MFYTSNLVIGLETGLNDPAFLLHVAQETGTGIEFFLHDGAAYRDRLAQVPQWLGNLPRTTHGPFLGVEATAPEGTQERVHMLEAYERAFQTAKRLGSKHMVFHTNQRVIQPDEKAAAQALCESAISTLIGMGRETGVTLLIENLGIQKQGVCLYDEDEFLSLLARFPEADCLIDVGHLHVAGWNAEHVLSALGERIVGYHFHNNDGVSDSHRRITDGTFEYEPFMQLYKRYTPNADITLEYGDDHGIAAQDVIGDLRWIMSLAQ